MPRAGLTTAIVVREAADLADEIGYDALTLTALAARLNVAVPSLYKHVGSLDDLRRGVALLAVGELGSALRAALDASAPHGGLRPLADAYRRYVLEHPGQYAATVRAAPADDEELREAGYAAVRTVVEVLEASGLRGDDLIHAARSLRAALHGFTTLESAGGFGLPQDVDRSFAWMVAHFEGGLRRGASGNDDSLRFEDPR